MTSRGARQRLKGGGGTGGDPAPAAEKLRELLGSREAGGAEPRPEYVCGAAGAWPWRWPWPWSWSWSWPWPWPAGGRAAAARQGLGLVARARALFRQVLCS
jgi:hypothetical protein